MDWFCQELALGGNSRICSRLFPCPARPLGLSRFSLLSGREAGGRGAQQPSRLRPTPEAPQGDYLQGELSLAEDSQDRKEPLNQKWGHGSGWDSGLL